MPDPDATGYRYAEAGLNHSYGYLLPAVSRLLDELNLPYAERRLFELGCGNGSVAHELTRRGWDVTRVDPAEEGIKQARAACPELKLASGSAYDDLATHYGQFPMVLSLEVVEHVYAPGDYVRTVFDLLAAGGTVIISPLSPLLEEPRLGADRQDGRSHHRILGSRPHQVLVD